MSSYSKKRSNGGNSRNDDLPQSQQSEYDGLKLETTTQPRENCCTWKMAAVFLIIVAASLVLAWVVLPAEDIVAKYVPHFDEPANPYNGPEAGTPGENSGGGSDSDVPPGQTPDDGEGDLIGTVVPSFMQCPEGELCCNGSVDNCKLRVDEMMFGLVHNAMASEGLCIAFLSILCVPSLYSLFFIPLSGHSLPRAQFFITSSTPHVIAHVTDKKRRDSLLVTIIVWDL